MGLLTTETNVEAEAFSDKDLRFSVFDYSLFVFMLGISALVGIYFGCCGRKQETTKDYLLGGKTMTVFPIAMSLVASHLSGISLLGLPAEIYAFGTQFWSCFISLTIVAFFISYVYLPVFHKLQLVCCYEYLDLRFDYRVRLMSSVLFAVGTCLYLPLVVYIPALAFSQVSGLSLHLVSISICVVVIFYTTIGGLKAVVWTDTIQFTCTLGSMILVIVIGTYWSGGFSEVWSKAEEGKRLEFFNYDPDITQRCTLWGIAIGLTVSWLSHLGVNQGCVQRFLAVPTITDARRSIVIFFIGVLLTKSMCCYTGLLLYHRYWDCDPLSAKRIERADQILPYYVMDIAGNIKGLPGLFIAGIVSAALSTMSAHLNTLAGTVYEDFVKPHMPKNTTEKRASDIMKIIVVVTGVMCMAIMFVIQNLGGVIQLGFALPGITAGTLLGLFTLGMIFPSANAKGAFWGAVFSQIFMFIMVGGAQYHIYKGNIRYKMKPVSTEGCNNSSNITEIIMTTVSSLVPEPSDPPFFLFRISFMFNTLFGFLTTLFGGLVISWLTREDKTHVNPDHISPLVHFLLPKKQLQFQNANYNTVEQALQAFKASEKDKELEGA